MSVTHKSQPSANQSRQCYTLVIREQSKCIMQTCAAVRACVIRCLLTLARTRSLCWVRAIARVGLDRERLVVGRELLSSSLICSEPITRWKIWLLLQYVTNLKYNVNVSGFKKWKMTWCAVVGDALWAEPFLYRYSIQRRCETFHVIPSVKKWV